MDWNDVIFEDFVDVLKEVDWFIFLCLLGEFFGNFSVLKNDFKWEGCF